MIKPFIIPINPVNIGISPVLVLLFWSSNIVCTVEEIDSNDLSLVEIPFSVVKSVVILKKIFGILSFELVAVFD